jgi:hypothetical protein
MLHRYKRSCCSKGESDSPKETNSNQVFALLSSNVVIDESASLSVPMFRECVVVPITVITPRAKLYPSLPESRIRTIAF